MLINYGKTRYLQSKLPCGTFSGGNAVVVEIYFIFFLIFYGCLVGKSSTRSSSHEVE